MATDVDFDFRANADRLLLVARGILSVDVAQILSTIQTAHTLGPFVDPTKYRDALDRGDLDRVDRLAHAAQAFRTEAERLIGDVCGD